ncbi:MAG TPA: nitroreductase/quinone reductase family protein, partial [Candidatus Dormibacteraeota bacterium]
MTTSTTDRQATTPASVGRFNRVVVALLRRGVPIGPMQLLTVTGRRSGEPRTTPIATFTFAGGRYVMQAWPRAGWVHNARTAGW